MPTCAEKIAYVRGRFLPQIRGYMVADLQNMLAINKIPGWSGACNFPIALYTLSCMDYLGFLTSAALLKTDGGDTSKRLAAYANSFFGEPHRGAMSTRWEETTKIFRHGLSHVFFPKQGGVSRAHGPNILETQSGVLVLDADTLAHAFINSVATLDSQVIGDDTLSEKIFDRLEILENQHSSVVQSLKGTAATNSTTTSTYTVTTSSPPQNVTLTPPPTSQP